MVSKLTKLSAATLLALGVTGQAMAEDDRYLIQVSNNGKGIVKALAAQMGGDVHIEGNGFIAATFTGKSIDEVRGVMNNPHVMLVEEDVRRVPLAIYNDDAGDPTTTQLTPYAIYQSQANQLTLQSGQKVCVIDSGLDQTNNDFDWSVITGDNDSGTGNWYENGGPHGTHVAGTVAAADNGFGVVGMAPGVPLHIIKVFNASGWGYSSDLAHAADLCDQAGANIITMSLGGGGANSTEENAFNTFTDNGGLVLAAAGNDGNNVRSYPAGYKSVMMIGANDADNNIASFSQFPSNSVTVGRGKNRTTEVDDGYGVEVTVGGVATLSTYPAGGATLSSMTAGGVGYASSAMENSGSATGSTYFMGTAEATDSGANGKVCLIDRGVISFFDKVNNCENSGGVGAVIINNEPGMLYGTLGETNTTSIPAVGAAQEDRSAILAASTATVSVEAGDYGYMDGTSMATPGAAGIAALIWSNNPNCTGADVRTAMKTTADDQGAAGRDDYFGYGIAKAKAANDYLAASSCGGGTPPTGNNNPVSSFTNSCTDLACSFDGTGSSDSDGTVVSYSWDFGDGNSATTATASNTYAANGTYTVSLTVTDNEGASNTSSQSVTVSDGTEPPAEMTLSGFRQKGNKEAVLNWSGLTGTNVDVYINGSLNNSTANDGSTVYSVNRNSSYTFEVCETGSTVNCTNSITL
ncbi:MAG: S8 family serine peptidase [Kangiellaceae bacterium]